MTARSYSIEGWCGWRSRAPARAGEELEARIRLAVIGQQVGFGKGELQLLLRMLGDVVIEERQRLGALAVGSGGALEQQRCGARARLHCNRGIVQPAVVRNGALRIAVARGDVGQVELRGIVPLAAREQGREALLRLLQVPRLEREQREPPVDLGRRDARGAAQ